MDGKVGEEEVKVRDEEKKTKMIWVFLFRLTVIM